MPAAEEANEEAKKFASSKAQREQLENQFDEYRKNGQIRRKTNRRRKAARKSGAGRRGAEGGGGGQAGGGITNPFGSGVGGTTLGE